VERSNDGQEFYSVVRITGAGTTAQQKNYSFHDKEPVVSLAYYRLRQTDFDGKQTFSSIVKIDAGIPVAFSFLVTPNPATQGRVVLAVSGVERGDKVSLRMYSLDGREVFSAESQSIDFDQDFPTVELSPGQQLQGLYVIKIISSKGTAFQKFMMGN
jgi:hypothetical protein